MRNQSNFSKTLLYKLQTKDTNKIIYVNYTTNQYVRKAYLKKHWNTKLGQVYDQIRKNGGWNNIEFVPIKTLKCESNLDASIFTEIYCDEQQITL